MRFLAALRFLTIIPLPRWREASAGEVGFSLAYFPLVGVIIGFVLAGLDWVFSLFLPTEIANVLLIISLVIITGALHLDGLADTCDGMAGRTIEDRWRIMKDSHAGSFGVVGVLSLLLLKYVSLGKVPDFWLMPTLVLMPVLSRWAMVYAVFAYPYARPSGLGTAFKAGAIWPVFVLATLTALAVALVLARLSGLVIMAGVWVITVALATYFRRRFAGLTGDTYGAINEIAEVSVLIIVSILAYNQVEMPW
ncbi:MAG: adenosylcobinamide-GDP ribazoletransferase [Chloroflexi bacterium]|nr:adenosylcobinamide-GDP ribazoletransferase [Chloroflexota bacterium]